MRGASGAPSLRVQGRAGRIAQDLGVRSWLVSLSHTPRYATASVIVLAATGD